MCRWDMFSSPQERLLKIRMNRSAGWYGSSLRSFEELGTAWATFHYLLNSGIQVGLRPAAGHDEVS